MLQRNCEIQWCCRELVIGSCPVLYVPHDHYLGVVSSENILIVECNRNLMVRGNVGKNGVPRIFIYSFNKF